MSPTVYSPPVATYTALGTTTLSGTDTEVLFSSIPSGFRDLVLVADANAAQSDLRLRINGSTGSDYNWVYAQGNGSSATSNSTSNGTSLGYFYVTANQPFVSVLQFLDYSATDKQKSLLIRNNKNTERVSMIAGRWASTSAITSISLFTLPSGGYTSGTFSLYGIEA